MSSCQKNDVDFLVDNQLVIPDYYPNVDFPSDNDFTKARWELGKKLFYDPIMSVDSSLSCNSCHKQEYGFADNVQFSNGVFDRKGIKNAPSLANVVLSPYLNFDGGVSTLEKQVLVPIQEHNEFDFNILLIQNRLKNDDDYVEL
ncbi:MAG: cytochrome-c peroxidase, partial [Bacteroidia bacterium]